MNFNAPAGGGRLCGAPEEGERGSYLLEIILESGILLLAFALDVTSKRSVGIGMQTQGTSH